MNDVLRSFVNASDRVCSFFAGLFVSVAGKTTVKLENAEGYSGTVKSCHTPKIRNRVGSRNLHVVIIYSENVKKGFKMYGKR